MKPPRDASRHAGTEKGANSPSAIASNAASHFASLTSCESATSQGKLVSVQVTAKKSPTDSNVGSAGAKQQIASAPSRRIGFASPRRSAAWAPSISTWPGSKP